eukprot:9176146-Pyramimonas_sp.AAC.1
MPDSRGQGLDFIEPRLIKEASEEAKTHLIQLLESIEEQCALPFQQLFALVALIPKPDGGKRPIALPGFVCTLLLRIRKPFITAWD